MSANSRVFAVLIAASVVSISSESVLAQYEDRVLADNPFMYLRFDEPAGETTVQDSGGGSGIDGTYENVETGVPGLTDGSNTAARYNGSDALVRVVDDPQINVTNGPWEDRSIEFWFSADDVSLEDPQVLFEEGGTTRGLAIYIQEGLLYMGIWNRANDDSGVSSPWVNDQETPDGTIYLMPREVQSNTSTHVALVYDGDPTGFTGTVTGYVDGGQFDQRDGAGQFFNHGDDIGIGAMDTNIFLVDGTNPGGDGLYFAGVLDELAMYDYPLGGDRILARVGLEIDLPGDFNEDGVLDMADYEIMTGNFNTGGAKYPDGDMNFDGRVSLPDHIAFRDAFAAANGGAGVAAVPEPSTMLLGLAGIAALVQLRRKRRTHT